MAPAPGDAATAEASRKRRMEETAPTVGTASYGPPAPFAAAAAAAAPSPLLVETSPPPGIMPSPVGMDTTGSSSSSRPAKALRTEKAYKGLRHFSMMVCKKVEEKGTTSYNEVADELVKSVVEQRKQQNPAANYDEKNIRRRVYDALNVLMAMDIITKEKKEITWKGLPTEATQDLEMLQRELDFRKHEVQKKRDTLMELLVQQVCFRNLVAYNQKRELEQATANVAATAASAAAAAAAAAEAGEERPPPPPPPSPQDNKIPLPFIIVNTHSSAVIQCNMSRDLTDVKFDFSSPFEINDDNTILKRLGMNRTTVQGLQEWMPEEIFQYCQEHKLLDRLLGAEGSSSHSAAGAGTAATSDYQPPYSAAAAAAVKASSAAP